MEIREVVMLQREEEEEDEYQNLLEYKFHKSFLLYLQA